MRLHQWITWYFVGVNCEDKREKFCRENLYIYLPYVDLHDTCKIFIWFPILCPSRSVQKSLWCHFSEAWDRLPDNYVSVETQSSMYLKRNMTLIHFCLHVRLMDRDGMKSFKAPTDWRSSGFYYFYIQAMWKMWFSFPPLWLFNFAVSNQIIFYTSCTWILSVDVFICMCRCLCNHVWGWFQD